MMKKGVQFIIVMSRLLLVLLILGGSFTFAMFQGGIVSWTIFYSVLPFALYSMLLFFYPVSNFVVRRQVDSVQLQKGDTIKIEVVLTRRIPFPLLYTVIRDEWSSEHMHQSIQTKQELFIVGWRRKLTWVYDVDQLMRGEHVAECVRIEVTDFFGWIKKSKVFPVKDRLLVYPKIEPIHYGSLDAQYADSLAVAPYSLLQDTTLVTGVREYEAGDQMSRIHWKSFARTQTLMTKEFENQNTEAFQLVFDNRFSATFEVKVSFAASILRTLQEAKRQIDFSSLYQADAFEAIQSEEQFSAVFTYLAKVQPIKSQQVTALSSLEKTAKRSGTIVVITHRVDGDWLQLINELFTLRSVICFVVVEGEQFVTHEMKAELQVAATKGVTVKLIKQERITDGFKEVVST